MKIHEVVGQSLEGSRLEQDIMDMLISLKASGIDQYETQTFVDQINELGHALTVEALLGMWQDSRPPIVSNVTANTLKIGTPSVNNNQGASGDDSIEAGRQARKNIKSR